MKSLRIVLWALVAIAAVAGGLLYWRHSASRPPQQSAANFSFGGPFTLVDSQGQPFASSQLSGRPYAIFFGFTHCPDVCPTALARLVRLRRQLGSEDAIRLVFVTVDPERDGPADVGRYAELFGSPIIGLTGSPAQIAQVKKNYGIFSEKVGRGENYSVDHTATVLLFDKAGHFQSTIAPDETDAAALAKLRRLVGS
jgi:protein SCO1/2